MLDVTYAPLFDADARHERRLDLDLLPRTNPAAVKARGAK